MTSKELHNRAFVLDSHCDTPSRIWEGYPYTEKNTTNHVDFDKLFKGGVDASFFAIYTSNLLEPDAATRKALQLIAATYDAVYKYPGKAAIAHSVQEARELKERGMLAIFLGMENGLPIQKDLSLLRLFYRMGVRYLTLTHSRNNDICDSCTGKTPTWHGVSPFGVEVIKEMNRLGMMVDVSHISDESFYDCLKYSKAPIVATHSCCRALANRPRNMTDQMIKDLAAKDGVIQINFYPAFISDKYYEEFSKVSDEFEEKETAFKQNTQDPEIRKAFFDVRDRLFAIPRPGVKDLVDHIDHAVSLVGPEHVGLGSDYDGIEIPPKGLEDVTKMPAITAELKRRGYSDSAITGILGGNFLRLFSQVEQIAHTL